MTSIIYYDVDETLFTHDPEHAPAVRVIDENGNLVKRLDSHSFHSYTREHPDHTFDFSEYRCSERFYRSVMPIVNIVGRVKQDHTLGYKVELLTAREDLDNKQTVIDTFAKYGVYIDKQYDPNPIHLHRAGNLGHSSPAQNKYEHITAAIRKHGYTKVTMWDDNIGMYDVMKRISKENFIETLFLHIVPPHHEGQFESYHFYNGELISHVGTETGTFQDSQPSHSA